MPNPNVFQTIVDGALGSAVSNTDGASALVGVSSSGTANTVYVFTRPSDVSATLGSGPLVEAACYRLEASGGPVYCCPVTSSVGSNSAVTAAGGGLAVTLSGTPLDAYQGKLKYISGGAVGTATFQYSLDNGDNWSDTLSTAATYALPGTGLTLTFPAGTYSTAHTHSWTSTAPYYTLSNLNSAINALLASPYAWEFCHVVGAGTAATDSATIAAGLQVLADSAASNYRYIWFLQEAADDTDTNLLSSFASFLGKNVAIGAGYCELRSSVSGRIYKRSIAWPAHAMAARVVQERNGIATELGRVRNGSLPGVVSLYRDEAATPALNAGRFITATTYVGNPGFFITESKTMAAPGSDYALLPRLRVVNKAATICRQYLLTNVNETVETNSDGTITEAAAQKIEEELNNQLSTQMVQTSRNVQRCTVAVDRSVNVLSTSTLNVETRTKPYAYAKTINNTIGFTPITKADS